MVESIQSATSAPKAAMTLLDENARKQAEPVLDQPQERQVQREEQVKRDLSGQPLNEVRGFIFAPGYARADERGLVPWPSIDPQIDRFVARRSVEANAVVFRQARQAYEAISAMGDSANPRRS